MSNQRRNNSTRANIYTNRGILARGSFKNVWLGTYTRGPQRGQKCVAKEFRTGSVFEEHYFAEEMKITSRAQQVIDAWDDADLIDRKIILNTPEIWTYEESGHKVLIEPFIEGYEKFNSNSGWAPDTGVWGEVMQALSHFSYHKSGGQFLLCDLQGGPYDDGYILSDPVIMSQLQSYGPADLGPDGIRSFFQRHRCSCFCQREWSRPRILGRAVIPLLQGTTMIEPPCVRSRMPLSSLAE